MGGQEVVYPCHAHLRHGLDIVLVNLVAVDPLFYFRGLWAKNTHWKHRRDWPVVLASPEMARVRLVRLHRPRDADAWLRALGEPVRPSREST